MPKNKPKRVRKMQVSAVRCDMIEQYVTVLMLLFAMSYNQALCIIKPQSFKKLVCYQSHDSISDSFLCQPGYA